ncbi:hypothetical protein [Streptomyces erythrochromogenes]|uniref:hypothetical protein n=1 Tax=Streptomyces erythrochromogenes TaxID=285574 RepID=UPI00370007DD
MTNDQIVVPEGLTRRARSFISSHGVRLPISGVDQHREKWLTLGIPSVEVDRVQNFAAQWGGLALPPSPQYEGGPKVFLPDTPEESPGGGWCYEAGPQRTAVPYGFVIGPEGEFGIQAGRWVPLHGSVEGWVESIALAYHAFRWATAINVASGEAVEELQLEGYQPVIEVDGMSDSWLRGKDSLVAVYRGVAECMAAPQCRIAVTYSGLGDWGLNG